MDTHCPTTVVYFFQSVHTSVMTVLLFLQSADTWCRKPWICDHTHEEGMRTGSDRINVEYKRRHVPRLRTSTSAVRCILLRLFVILQGGHLTRMFVDTFQEET